MAVFYEVAVLDIGCIVLAGGQSRRLGWNKITAVVGGKVLLERVLSTLASFKSEIIIVTAKDSSLPGMDNYPELRIIKDVYPGKGALGGIYTGLRASKFFYNLVVACDMPFLNRNLLQYMVGVAEGFDLVAYKVKDRLEPLHAVYSKNCLAPLENLLRQNNLRIMELLPHIKVRYIMEEEVDRLDPRHLSFFNINTEAELRAGIELANRPGEDLR
jgi:molybdopterin-guanine dinucleotide biosynthesis protein A